LFRRVGRVPAAFAVYCVVMCGLAIVRWHVWSYGADTGTFTQIGRNAFRGFDNTSELGSHFAVHWAPILVVLYPFVAATHAGLAIQIVQVVTIGLGVFPFYSFLRRYADDGLAATLACTALFYPPLLAVAFDEFHEIAFYPVLVFGMLWAIDAGRWRSASAFAFCALLVREEALIVLAAFGIVLALSAFATKRDTARGLLFLEPRDRARSMAFGGVLAAASVAIFWFYFAVLAPSLGGWTASHFYAYPFARGPRDVVLALVRRPLDVIRAIATPGRATYLLEAFAPVLFLALRSRFMLVVVPGLAIVVLSSDASAWRMGNHYAGLWAPWMLVGAAGTVVSVARERSSARLGSRLALGIVLACAIVLAAFDPMHPAHYLRAPYADRTAAVSAFDRIPRDASVFTHDEWFARMAGRYPAAEHVWNEPAYAILAEDFPHAETFEPFMRLQVRRDCYAVVDRIDRVVVYRRLSSARAERCRIPRAH
jgi:uncharacterized membrane protein